MKQEDITFRSWAYLNAYGIKKADFMMSGDHIAFVIRLILESCDIVFMYLVDDGIIGYYNR